MEATPGQLRSFEITPESDRVAEQTSMEVEIMITHLIPQGGIIKMILPAWNPNAPESAILPMI